MRQQLEPRYADRTTAEHGWDEEFQGYSILGAIDAADLHEAAGSLALCDAPAPKSVISRELTRLRAMTASRADNLDDKRVLATVYTEAMAAYPEDVVVATIAYWVSAEKWWPTWSELKDALDFRCRKRNALRAALRMPR